MEKVDAHELFDTSITEMGFSQSTLFTLRSSGKMLLMGEVLTRLPWDSQDGRFTCSSIIPEIINKMIELGFDGQHTVWHYDWIPEYCRGRRRWAACKKWLRTSVKSLSPSSVYSGGLGKALQLDNQQNVRLGELLTVPMTPTSHSFGAKVIAQSFDGIGTIARLDIPRMGWAIPPSLFEELDIDCIPPPLLRNKMTEHLFNRA